MSGHVYRISFRADGINFFTNQTGDNEADATKKLLIDVQRNGCPPFFSNIRTVEKIESVERLW